MTRMNIRWFLSLAPLLLVGCLLPQPDTPIIPPPGAATTGTGQGTDRTMMPETPPSPMAGVASTGLISGKITGEGVTAVTAVPSGGNGSQVRQDVGSSGIFDLTLAPGDYQLELTVGDKTTRAALVITVKANETRTFSVTVTRDPLGATVSETTPPESSPPDTEEQEAEGEREATP